jgi:hypothetical protein
MQNDMYDLQTGLSLVATRNEALAKQVLCEEAEKRAGAEENVKLRRTWATAWKKK